MSRIREIIDLVRVRPGKKFRLKDHDPAWAGDYLGFWARQAGDTARAYVAYVDPGAGTPQVAFMVSSL